MSFLFHLAIFCTTTAASSILPVLRSQRGDSGTNHQYEKRMMKGALVTIANWNQELKK